jgi:hypothetical protein
LYASAHGCEEFWYSNAPPSIEDACGGGSFRALVVLLDDQVVGTQLPFPVLYTGGDNPLLWKPQSGIYSLSIPPYFFDMTPFLPILNDGCSHTLKVQVLGNGQKGQWFVDPVLVVYQDFSETVVRGSINRYEYTTSGPNVTISNATVTWETTFHSNLVAETLLQGDLFNRSVSIAAGLDFFAINQAGQTQETKLLSHTRLTSTAYDRLDDIQYPFFIRSSGHAQKDRFTIHAKVDYAVEHSMRSLDDDVSKRMFYRDAIQGEATYSRSTDRNRTIYIAQGNTRQNFTIITGRESCVRQLIQTEQGRVRDLQLFQGKDCLPTDFCATFPVCANPVYIPIPNRLLPQPSSLLERTRA